MGAKLVRAAVTLTLMGTPLLSVAQTSLVTLAQYISQSVDEINNPEPATIAQWSEKHPGEVIEGPEKGDPEKASNFDAQEKRNLKLEGRWCLRSIAEIELAGGVHVRRVALFYPPLVEQIYDKPLPPLPTESGESLRRHGCRLVRILHEIEGVPDPQNFADTVAKQISEKRIQEPGHFLELPGDDYWSPVWSSEKFGQPLAQYYFFTRNPRVAGPTDHPDFLLEWRWGTLDYGQPDEKTIHPEAGQPWLALRAAKLARLPEDSTLDMLSFLAPQVGDTYERAPLHCDKELVPVLKKWLDLAAHVEQERHAAAILLADRVLDRLWDCQEFSNGGYIFLDDEKIRAEDKDPLEKNLQELGIQTETTARLGNESYSGNLMEQVLKLAPEGAVNELGRMAILNGRCQWSSYSNSADCTKIIHEGEDFLTRFPEDEWTPSVHLILAEAYTLMASNPGDEASATPEAPKEELEKKAAAHYRSWFAKSKNDRDRPLVWQEIWAIEAGMGPSLFVPAEVRR